MVFLIFALLVGTLIIVFATLIWLGSCLVGRHWGKQLALLSLPCFAAIYPAMVFVIVPFVLAQMLSNAGTRQEDLRLDINPRDFGCDFEEVTFSGQDGGQVSGWWMQGVPNSMTFIITHGLFRDRKEVTERGCRLNKIGSSVLVYDLRSHGKSEKAPITVGYKERFDVLGAVCFAHQQMSSELVIMGVSMGAVATLMAAPEMNPPPSAIISDSSFASLWDTVQQHSSVFLGGIGFPFNHVFVWNLTRLGKFSSDALDLPRVFSNSKDWPPTLLLHGERDERISIESAETLLEALPTEKKQLTVFRDVGHGGAWESDPDRYLSIIEDFLDQHDVGLRRRTH